MEKTTGNDAQIFTEISRFADVSRRNAFRGVAGALPGHGPQIGRRPRGGAARPRAAGHAGDRDRPRGTKRYISRYGHAVTHRRGAVGARRRAETREGGGGCGGATAPARGRAARTAPASADPSLAHTPRPPPGFRGTGSGKAHAAAPRTVRRVRDRAPGRRSAAVPRGRAWPSAGKRGITVRTPLPRAGARGTAGRERRRPRWPARTLVTGAFDTGGRSRIRTLEG